MDYIERKITVIEPSYVKPIYVVQGSNMVEIRITLTDWDIPNGAEVKWQVATSTKGELNTADVDGNTIYIRPYTTTFSEAGKGYLQVKVEHDGRVLISFKIDVYIQEDVFMGDTEGSNSDVVKALVNQYVDDATGTLFEDLEAQAQSELASIRATGQSVLDSIPAEYSELEDATYNAYPLGTAEGNPIIIEDGSDNIPVKSLSVDLVPKQDLNGYDHPWIGGAGKNLLKVTATSQTINGVTFTVNEDGTIVANGTATATASLFLNRDFGITDDNQYIFSGCPSGGSGNTYRMDCYWRKSDNVNVGVTSDIGSGASIRVSDKEDAVKINTFILVIMSGHVCNNLVFKPMIRLASATDSAFEPYENICPISGYDGVVVKRTGKNLRKPTARTATASGVTYTVDANGKVTMSGTATGDTSFTIYSSGDRTAPFTGDYTVSLNGADKATIHGNLKVMTYHFTEGQTIGNLSIKVKSGVTYNESFNVQLELGSTATEYEPYKGQEYTVTFPSSAGTVYSGRLNVTTGELVVDRKMVTNLNSANWTAVTYINGFGCILSDMKVSMNDSQGNMCSQYKVVDTAYSTLQDYQMTTNTRDFSASPWLLVSDSRFTSVNDFKASLNGVQFCYKLATPKTYQLTPTEVSTLLGYNVIQSDGDMDLEYRADIVGYYTGMNEAVDIVKNTADYIDTSKEFSVKEKRILECDIPKCESSLEAYLNGELSFTLRHRDASNSKAYFPLSPKYTYKLTVDSDKSYTAKLVVEPQRALFLGGLYNGIPIVSAGNKRTNLINVIEQAFIYISCDYTTAVDGYKDGAYVGRKTAYCGVYSPSVVDVSEYDYVCLVSNGVGQIYYSLGDSNRFVGKKWCSYGDSITEQNRWQNLLVAKYGLIHTNKGLGGSCVTGETDNTVAPMTDSARINSIDTDTDIITVMGGTNDFDYCADIGTIDAFQESYNEATFMGSLASIVKKLQARCPNARIILMSLVNSRGVTGQNSDDQQVSRYGFTPYDFAKATKEVAEWLSVDYIDTWSCGINQLNRAKYISDSVHPNDEGGKMIAFKIMQYFDTLEV